MFVSKRKCEITFRTKATGESSVGFIASSVLANDGEGLEILTNQGTGKAGFTIAPAKPVVENRDSEDVSPLHEESIPALLPKVSSLTHSVSVWSAKTTGVFNFTWSEAVTAMRLLLDDQPQSIPTIVYAPPVASRTINDLEEGISYLHAQYKNTEGWGEILHYEIKIDTAAPENFEIKEVATSTFIFEASDLASGISHYEIQIDRGEVHKFVDNGSHVYRAPELTAGEYTLFVKVFDLDGNFATATIAFISKDTQLAVPVAAVVKNETPVVSNLFVPNGTMLITVLSIVIPCL